MACGPRTYNLRNRALDVRLHTPSLLLPLPHYVFRKKTWRAWPPQKTYGKKNAGWVVPEALVKINVSMNKEYFQNNLLTTFFVGPCREQRPQNLFDKNIFSLLPSRGSESEKDFH